VRDVEREAIWDKRVRAVGEFIEAIGGGRGTTGLRGGSVTRITIRCPSREEPEALLVVKATGEDGDVVAFVGGLDVSTALLTWRAKDGSKGLKWRADKPWSEREG
jgi:hypothetical protein